MKPSWRVLSSPRDDDWKFTDVLNTAYNDALIEILQSYKSKTAALSEDVERWLFRNFHYRAQFEFSMVGARAHYLSNKDIEEIRSGNRRTASPGVYMDVYEQVMANFDIFIEYIWKHRKEITSW